METFWLCLLSWRPSLASCISRLCFFFWDAATLRSISIVASRTFTLFTLKGFRRKKNHIYLRVCREFGKFQRLYMGVNMASPISTCLHTFILFYCKTTYICTAFPPNQIFWIWLYCHGRAEHRTGQSVKIFLYNQSNLWEHARKSDKSVRCHVLNQKWTD